MEEILDKYKKYVELLNDITDKNIDLTIKLDKDNPIKFFDDLEDGMNQADELYDMVNTSHFYVDSVRDKSTTFGDELSLKIKALKKVVHSLRSHIKLVLPDLIQEYMKDKSKQKIVDDIIENNYNNVFVITMLKIIHKTSEPPEKIRINKYITLLKNQILGTVNLDTYTDYDAVQSILINAGFVPASDFMTEAEILDNIKKELRRIPYSGGDEEQGILHDEIIGGAKIAEPAIVKKLQKEKLSFMVLKRTVGTPVVYNIDAYISAKYISDNNMETKNGEGITDNFIKRFSTPRFLDKSKSWDGTGMISAHLDDSKSHSFIIETLDGITYRFLSVAKYYISVKTDIIKHLQNGIGTRHDDYNAIHERQIMKNAFNISGISIMKQYENSGMTFDEHDFIVTLKNEPRKQTLAKKVYSAIDSYIDKRGFIDMKKHADSALAIWARTPDLISKYGSVIGSTTIENKDKALSRSGLFKIPYRSARDYYDELY